MQSVSADLAAAILDTDERPQALVRLRCDWDRDGSFTDADSDISADVISVELSRELSSDIPQAAKLFSGAAAAEATVTLGTFDPAGDPTRHAAWKYSPLNSASPLFAYNRIGAPATLEFGFVTASGPEYVTVLTGRVRSIQVTSGGRQAVMRISDRSEDMRKQVALPMVIADGDVAGAGASVRPGLNTTFLADYVARRCGYYASPPPRTGCELLATFHGSAHPEIGNAVSVHGEFGSVLSFSPTPTFPSAAKWVQGINTDAGVNQIIQYSFLGSGVISPNNTRTVMVQGWWKLNSTGDDQALWIIYNNSSGLTGTNPFVSMFRNGSTGNLTLTFNRGGADLTNRDIVGPNISPGTSSWHYYAVLVSFTSTGVDATFRYDSTTTGPTNQATPSVTGGPVFDRCVVNGGRVGAYAYDRLDGLVEDFQVTTESSVSTWDNAFTPTAEIHASSAIDNRLVATPAAKEEGWSLFQTIAESEFATAGFTETGTLFYWPRRRWTTAPYTSSQRTLTSSTALKELETVEATDQVRNRVVIRATIPEVLDSSTVWKLASRVKLTASQTKTLYARFDEPVGNVDTSVVAGAPTALGSSRYLAGTRLDGQGTSVTSNVAFVVTVETPQRARIDVTNNNAFTIYLVADENDSASMSGKPMLWIDGQRVKFGEEGASSSETATATDATSITNFGEQLLELEDNPFRQDADDLQALADDLIADLADPAPAMSDVPAIGDPRIQLGDRATIVDPEGLAMSSDFHCSKVNLTFDEGGLSMVLSLRGA